MQLNNKLLIGGVALALAAVATVTLVPEDDISQDITHSIPSATVNTIKTKQSSVEVDYAKEDLPGAYGKSVVSEPVKKEIKQNWEPTVETKAYDTTKTYEIAVVNPNRDPEYTASSYIPVSGRIDGRHFTIKVPEHLVKNGSSGISIRIKNLKTGKMTSTPISFMDELKDRTRSAHLNIDSENIDEYEYISEEKMLPVPGERYVGN